jgi:hypothetical protein
MQCRSRALSALRVGPEITRFARPTSMTIDSELIRIRVTELSHASLSTVWEEIGSGESSSSAAGAPGRPSSVSSVVVTFR